jgi:hypothetical protein
MTNEDFKKSNQHQRNPWDGVRNEADDSFESNEIVDFDNLPQKLRQAIEACPELSRTDFCSPELLSWLASDSGNLNVLLDEVLAENMDVDGMLNRNANAKQRIQEPDYKAIGLAEDFFDRLENRISTNLVEVGTDSGLADSSYSDADVDLEPQADDYGFLFDHADTDIDRLVLSSDDPSSSATVSRPPKNFTQPGLSSTRQEQKRQHRRWIPTAAALVVVALSVGAFVLMRPQLVPPVSIVTVETVCNESLSWNPNRDLVWSFEEAPVDRAYPSHLMKYRAQGWKKIALTFDDEAVVYNLIPVDDLSQQKAYLYVFSAADESFELPQEFRLSPNANLNYRRWSLACQQQDLIYVLVYDSDQADRVLDLVKVQDVG